MNNDYIKVYERDYNSYKQIGETIIEPSSNVLFGHSINVNKNGDIFAVSAPHKNNKKGTVSIFKYSDESTIELTDISNINMDKFNITGIVELDDESIQLGYARSVKHISTENNNYGLEFILNNDNEFNVGVTGNTGNNIEYGFRNDASGNLYIYENNSDTRYIGEYSFENRYKLELQKNMYVDSGNVLI